MRFLRFYISTTTEYSVRSMCDYPRVETWAYWPRCMVLGMYAM